MTKNSFIAELTFNSDYSVYFGSKTFFGRLRYLQLMSLTPSNKIVKKIYVALFLSLSHQPDVKNGINQG